MTRPLDTMESDPRLPESDDIVVIGAGVVAAQVLAGKGHSVALLDKGVVASEESRRNRGWCRLMDRDERESPLMQSSIELWNRLPAEISADMGYRRNGVVYATKDRAELAGWENRIDMARACQANRRVVGAEEAKRLTPVNSRVDDVVSPGDGRAEPARAAPALAVAARRRGATLHRNCAVWGLDTRDGRVAAVFTQKGFIRTGAAILAAGAWASMFLRRHGIDMPQFPVRSTVFATTPAKQVPPGGRYTPDVIRTRPLDGCQAQDP